MGRADFVFNLQQKWTIEAIQAVGLVASVARGQSVGAGSRSILKNV
jgi:hypothetical protein